MCYNIGQQIPPRLCAATRTLKPAGHFLSGGFAISKPEPAETLDHSEQLQLLRDRGMLIEDENVALSCLQHMTYFRLSGYWQIFANDNKQFQANTSFEQVLRIYRFDQKLRRLVSSAIEMIEVSLRANFTHVLACRHGSDAHLQKDLFFDRDKWEINHQKLKKQINRLGRQKQFGKKSPDRINEKSPIWEISEALTFGLLSMMYKNLNTPLRKEIADRYGQGHEVLVTWLYNLTKLRNYSSHHSRIWNRSIPVVVRQPSEIKKWNPESTRIYNSLLIIDYLLGKLPLRLDWYSSLERLLEKLPEEFPQKYMGFPDNWKN